MAEELNQVVEDEEVVEVEESTLNEKAEVAGEATQAKSEIDVEKLKADYEQKLAASQDDLNRMKSSLQKRESEITRTFQEEQSRLRDEIKQVRMSGMDEEAKKNYLTELAKEEQQNLATRNQELEQANAEITGKINAQMFFLEKGVPVSELNLTEGYDELVLSGYNYLATEVERLRKEVEGKATAKKKERKEAPAVDTSKGEVSTGKTWASLKKQYGSEENVYSLIEQGVLSPDILPD